MAKLPPKKPTPISPSRKPLAKTSISSKLKEIKPKQIISKPPTPPPKKKFILLWIFLFFAVASISASFYVDYIMSGLPSLEQLENPKQELATKVYSIDGEVLDQFYFKNRTHIQLEKIPKHLIDALIATEDINFYKHWGVTPWRFLRALVKNVFALRLKEGASTITQQLSRNLYNLQTSRENVFDKITRKIREFITAVQIEKEYSKNEILEMYLNEIYMGRSAYGVAAASSIFFDKQVSDLTLSESSLLIGIIKGPSFYDPIRHLDRALGRRNIVLSQMVKYDFISEETKEKVLAEPLNFSLGNTSTPAGVAPHYIEFVRQQLLQKAENYGFDLFRDGLSIYTTLDSRIQRHLSRAVEEHMFEFQKIVDSTWSWKNHYDILEDGIKKQIKQHPLYSSSNQFERDSISKYLRANKIFIDSVKKILQTAQVGVVLIDPKTGAILAMIGGADFKNFKYGLNHVTQIRRQPGSAFKPFVYTVAIDNGYSPSYTLQNQPVTITGSDGIRWSPENVDNSIGGEFTLREGLRESINLIAVHAIMEIAPKEQVAEYAKRMGIKSQVLPVESIALGTPEVTPLEMTSAFGVFANEGVAVEPISILRIEDKDGNKIEENLTDEKEVLSRETAYILTSMMEDVVNRGTGTRIRNYFNYPAAGKTGTTNNFSDAWFVGFTPQYVAGVWIGFDDHRIKFNTSEGQGGRAAAPLWGKFMQYIYDDASIPITKEYFSRPEGIITEIICLDTKKKATEFCPIKFTEIFNSKYPPQPCDKHISSSKEETGPRSVF